MFRYSIYTFIGFTVTWKINLRQVDAEVDMTLALLGTRAIRWGNRVSQKCSKRVSRFWHQNLQEDNTEMINNGAQWDDMKKFGSWVEASYQNEEEWEGELKYFYLLIFIALEFHT